MWIAHSSLDWGTYNWIIQGKECCGRPALWWIYTASILQKSDVLPGIPLKCNTCCCTFCLTDTFINKRQILKILSTQHTLMDEEYCWVSPVGYMSQITKGGGYAVSSKKKKKYSNFFKVHYCMKSWPRVGHLDNDWSTD